MATVRTDFIGDASKLKNTIGSVKTDVAKLASDMKSHLAQAFSIAAITGFARSVSDHVGKIKDMSEQFSITTDEVQRLDFAAMGVGKRFEDIGGMLIKLGAARQAAAEGNEDRLEAFQSLGISLESLNDPAKRNVDLLFQMVNALQQMEMNPAVERTFAELLGKSAPRLLTAFQEMGKIKFDPIPKEAIERIDAANKKLERLWLALKNRVATGAVDLFEIGSRLGKAGFNPSKALDLYIVDQTRAEIAAKQQAAEDASRVTPGGPLFENKKDKEKRADKFRVTPAEWSASPGDSMSRIGGFIGGQSNPVITKLASIEKVNQDSVKEQSKINDKLREIQDTLTEGL